MRYLTLDEMNELESLLLSIDDDEAMLLSALDGYLAGIAVCPFLILPSEWMGPVWGTSLEEALAGHDAPKAYKLVLGFYNEVIFTLDRGEYIPWLDEDTDGSPFWEIWAEGFGKAMGLRPQAWVEIAGRASDLMVRTAAATLLEMVAAAHTSSGETLSPELGPALREDASRIISGAVLTLHRERLHHHGKPDGPRTATAIGRNDPCPCGSGKKFKKCCLN